MLEFGFRKFIIENLQIEYSQFVKMSKQLFTSPKAQTKTALILKPKKDSRETIS
jgi:hypothetical protein